MKSKILIILIILIGLGVGGFFVYENFFVSEIEEKKEVEVPPMVEEKTEEEKEVLEEEIAPEEGISQQEIAPEEEIEKVPKIEEETEEENIISERLWEVEYHYKYPGENEEIISEGNVIVIYDKKVFDKEWVELQLKDTLNCIPILKDKFKIDLPAPAKTRLLILDRLAMDNEQPVSYATSPGIVNICTIEGYQSTIANIDYFRKKINEEKVCLNLHEMTHVFVAETPIPMWANEGLATYAEKEFDPSRAEVECRENGWYGPSYYGGDDIEQPYSDLSKPSGQNGEPGIYWYYTGYCFWIYIQERYGESTIPKILQELKKNENNYSLDFVKDIVNKVLNEDITEITKEKFGVPSE